MACLLWGPDFIAMPLVAKVVIGLGVFAIVFAVAWWEYRDKTGGP